LASPRPFIKSAMLSSPCPPEVTVENEQHAQSVTPWSPLSCIPEASTHNQS